MYLYNFTSLHKMGEIVKRLMVLFFRGHFFSHCTNFDKIRISFPSLGYIYFGRCFVFKIC